MIAVEKSKFQNLCCLSIVCRWTMASLIMFQLSKRSPGFDQFSIQLVSNCHRGLMLNVYHWPMSWLFQNFLYSSLLLNNRVYTTFLFFCLLSFLRSTRVLACPVFVPLELLIFVNNSISLNLFYGSFKPERLFEQMFL